MTKIYKSDALRSVHLMAEGLHKAGTLSDEKMKEFDEQCLAKIRPAVSYAAVQINAGRSGPWIIPNTVRRTRREVRSLVGDQYAFQGQTTAEGWAFARKSGIRIVPVIIEAIIVEEPRS
ncbi:hypothetical protein [Microvirga sp. Mcv34]|uniref:hypothetical protein n=1 Tax=Microvirga sp. Mcv34 TaxID=2926016 RepID=UPI0021CA72A4|nr:hypothetical protein [Microvirga sp. Mcv34]